MKNQNISKSIMFNNLKRPYKDATCYETLGKIKNILDEIGLKMHEVKDKSPHKGIYWSSVYLDKSQGEFYTNGKGRTPELALTSAYAEFMERTQNGLNYNFPEIILNDLKKKQKFVYFPDERYLEKDEFLKLPLTIRTDIIPYKKDEDKQKFMDEVFKRLEEKRQRGIKSVPFYDTKNKEIIHIPHNRLLLTVGSNGMASGNTKYEAIFQGLCEIIERWNASKVYYQRLTPPTVPDEFLKQFPDEYEIIQQIKEKTRLKVIVKDFSVDKTFTALGLLIIDEKKHKYRLNIGAETSFQVMLSRCLTEIHQGMENIEMFKLKMLPIPAEEQEWFQNEDAESLNKRNNEFTQFVIDGSGIYPPHLFKEIPDYDFDPGIYKCYSSYKEETLNLIDKFHAAGYNIYIRDVSFLGFPSYFVYIPFLSSVGKKTAQVKLNYFHQIEIDKILNDLYHFQKCNDKKFMKIAEVLEAQDKSIKVSSIFGLEFDADSPWDQMNNSFFLTLLWYRIGNIELAIKNFEAFLKTEAQVAPYYKAILTYLKSISTIKTENQAKIVLNQKGIDEEIAAEVFYDLRDPTKVFQHLNFPQCPDCGDCELKKECKTYRKINVQKNINEYLKAHLQYNNITQVRLLD